MPRPNDILIAGDAKIHPFNLARGRVCTRPRLFRMLNIPDAPLASSVEKERGGGRVRRPTAFITHSRPLPASGSREHIHHIVTL